MTEEDFPFKKQIVDGSTKSDIPSYLKDEFIDFSCVKPIKDDIAIDRKIRVDNLEDSGINFEGMDKSQVEAVL